jgi:hypothetical protein
MAGGPGEGTAGRLETLSGTQESVLLLKTVFHVHTDYSDDSDNSIEHLLDAAVRAGVRALAVTDHDTIEGARALAAAAPPDLKVIVGQEISTADGHLIGLFLREPVAPGLSVRTAAKEIRRQGGLIVVPHPFNTIFGCSLREAVLDIIDYIDIVETSNAQNLLPFPNRRSARFAALHAFPALVGSDTHHRDSLCSCYQLIPPFDGPASFLDAVRHALLVPGCHPLTYFIQAAAVVLRSRLGLPLAPAVGRNNTTPPRTRAAQPVPVRS